MAEGERWEGLGPEVLGEIVAGTVDATGEDFFARLVRHLCGALGTRYGWVTEWLPVERRLRAFAFWTGDRYYGAYEYRVADTPCEPVVDDRRLVHVPERLIELYADDPDIQALGAVSYMGVPLLDTDGSVLGHLAVMDDRPLPADPRAIGIFNVFAGRAAAELRRLVRERALREREERLARLVESAMDAIVELDGALAVVALNPAAERLFGQPGSAVRGAPCDVLLTAAARARLGQIAADIERQPPGRQSLWLPDGLDGVRATGETFPAEATLSRYQAGGSTHWTLILRNVDERLAAEERIRGLLDQTESLRAELDAIQGFDEIVGQSAALRRVLTDVERVAVLDTTVLVTGETGTGKELIARAIHRRSRRARGPLVAVNCAAIAPTLQESELFGHERGAFTGATQRREGRFKLADGGTLFLDEVGEMSLDLQAKLLRVLQEGEIEPVGGSRPVRVDVRVIAATNRDLSAMVEAGAFRRDLLYRLDVFPIAVPPLRERGDDVLLLAERFAQRVARRQGRTVAALTRADRERLLRYPWPGNVRELQNVVERAWITSRDGRRLDLDRALPEAPPPTVAAPPAGALVAEPILTDRELRELERRNVVRALETAGWRISGAGGAAERLGINPNTLASRLKALGISRRPEGPRTLGS